MVSKYSDNHLSERDIGEYRHLEGGRFAVVIYAVEDADPDFAKPQMAWETTPRLAGMAHPLFGGIHESGPLLKFYRYFYRVVPWVDTGEIIRSSAERDEVVLRANSS